MIIEVVLIATLTKQALHHDANHPPDIHPTAPDTVWAATQEAGHALSALRTSGLTVSGWRVTLPSSFTP